MLRMYRMKFYLNASHFIITDGNPGETHSHCFELILNIAPAGNDEIRFFLLEKHIDNILGAYQDKVLNLLPPFDRINPTVENLCIVFSDMIKTEIAQYNVLVTTVQMSETPTRSFIVDSIEMDIEEIREKETEDMKKEDLPSYEPERKYIRKCDEWDRPVSEDGWDVEVSDDDDYDINIDYGNDISQWSYNN